MKLAASPPLKDLLKENEAVINPHYMQQLLEYGIKLAAEGGLDAQSLLKDAEVMWSKPCMSEKAFLLTSN